MLRRDGYGYRVMLGMVVGLTIAYLGVIILIAQVAKFLLPAGQDQTDQAKTEKREIARR